MPLLIMFQNRLVKRRRKVAEGLQLTFLTARPGEKGEQIVVTDDDWARFGRIEHLSNDRCRHAQLVAGRNATIQ